MDYNKIYDLNYPLSNDMNSSSNFQISKNINTPYNALISNIINTSNNSIFLNSIIYDDESGCCCCKCCNSQIILNDPNNITFIQNGLCFVFFLFLFSSIFPLFLLSLAILNIFEEDTTIANYCNCCGLISFIISNIIRNSSRMSGIYKIR